MLELAKAKAEAHKNGKESFDQGKYLSIHCTIEWAKWIEENNVDLSTLTVDVYDALEALERDDYLTWPGHPQPVPSFSPCSAIC